MGRRPGVPESRLLDLVARIIQPTLVPSRESDPMARFCTLLMMWVMVACHAQPASRFNAREAQAKHPCSAATQDALMEIKVTNNSAVSICRSDGVGDCFYSAAAGRTFLAGRPDFNNDGHLDVLVRDFSGAYGNHDIIHFLGYAACATGEYVKVLDTFATSVELHNETSTSGWRDMSITRDCFDDSSQDVVTRRFRLTWRESAGAYGPPDNEVDLIQHCTMKEMALPPG